MPAPSVSLLIPTYNSEHFLPATLDSAQAQTHADLEIVISDNASTDSTLQQVRERMADDPRIRLSENQQNVGPVENFRCLLRLAQGQFAKFLMSDDLLDPNAVESLLQPLMADDRVVLATAKRRVIDEDGVELPQVRATSGLTDHDARIDGTAVIEKVLTERSNYVGEPSSALFRRGAVRPDDAFRFAGRSYRVLADLSLWITLLKTGDLHYAAAPLSSFRLHPGQDQRQWSVVFRGSYEWKRLVDDCISAGLLTDPAAIREAKRMTRPILKGLYYDLFGWKSGTESE